jgi:hypothetical protein
MAGLLDYLFDASNYSGQGGLLSRLMPSTASIPQSQGFPQDAPQQSNPIAVGGYQMPRVGNPDEFVPQQVMTPPNATLTQGQMQPEPSAGDRFLGGLEGFARGGGLLPGLAGAIRGFSDGGVNQTARFLVAKGIDPALAKNIVADPVLLRAVLPQMLGMGGQTDDIKEYQFAKREDPSLTFQKFMQQKKAVSGEYSLTPQYGTNDKGETVLIQTGKSGEAIQTKLPEGVKISSGVDKVDLGTSWGIIDKRTGQMVGTQPKDVAGKESAEEVGKARGQAIATLPTTIANAEQTLQVIKSLKEDPYRERATGLSSVFNAIPATGGFDYAQKLEQLKGRTFLEAFQALKGGGAITELEGKKAEAAIARLNPGQSEKSFLEALNELEQIVGAGIERAKQKAGQISAPQQAAAPKRIRLNADGSIAQ